MKTKLNVASFKDKKKVNICYYTKFEPVIYGKAEGFEADLLKAIFKLWMVEFKFHAQDDYEDIWLTPGEKNSEFDIAAAGIDPNSRSKNDNAVYTIPTAKYSQSLLIKRKNYDCGLIVNYKSFANTHYKIGVIGNTTGEVYARKRVNDNQLDPKLITLFETEDEMLDALKNDKIHAIARGSIGNEYQELKDHEFKTIELKSFGEEMAFSVDPNNSLLLVSLNEAIRIVTNDNKLSYADWLKNNKVFHER